MEMCRIICIRATLLVLVTWFTRSALSTAWDYDVYTGRHFNTLVTSSTADNDVIVTATILILFTPSCETEARNFKGLLRPWGPMDKYLILAFHDYVTYPRHIWYEFDDVDDLGKRYVSPGDDCIKVLYFEEGSRLSQPEVWDKKQSLYDWAWSKLLLDIPIFNGLTKRIVVKKEGQGDPWEIGTIEAEGSLAANTHMGLSIMIYDRHSNFLYGVWLEHEHRFSRLEITEELVSNFQSNHPDARTWVTETRQMKQEDSNKAREFQWQLAETFLLSFKQPLVLPKFTETGYLKTDIPADVYAALKAFYDNKKAVDGVVDEKTESFAAINADRVMTGMVELSDDVKSLVHKALLDQMQDWCQCALEETFFYGIREYYRGNVLRMHVDRVETHVISSILQIDQDLGQSTDWMLEVIDFRGKRQNITLHPGEMLLYESATLIHGRPKTFHGHFFANCFLHYKPVSDWNWERKYGGDIGYIITNNNDVIEPVDIINTLRSFKSDFESAKTEL